MSTLAWRRHTWRMYRFEGEPSPFDRIAEVERDPERMANEAHFTSLAAVNGTLYCGMTHWGRELLLAFDPKTEAFRELGFPAIAEREEVKLHRNLTVASDGALIFGTASLMSIPDCHGTPGGRIIRFDPKAEAFEPLGRPMAGTYIQSICLDEPRGRVYGNTWPARYFFDIDLATGATETFYVENCPEGAPCLDADGRVWSMYGRWYSTRQFLCAYDPDARAMNWTRLELPGERHDTSPIASNETILWRDAIYMGASSLVRLHPREERLEDLGPPVPGSKRVPCLTVGPDGLLYGAAGVNGAYRLFRYDGERFHDLGPIGDDEEIPAIVHALAFIDGRIYAGETDNHARSGYLWEAALPS